MVYNCYRCCWSYAGLFRIFVFLFMRGIGLSFLASQKGKCTQQCFLLVCFLEDFVKNWLKFSLFVVIPERTNKVIFQMPSHLPFSAAILMFSSFMAVQQESTCSKPSPELRCRSSISAVTCVCCVVVLADGSCLLLLSAPLIVNFLRAVTAFSASLESPVCTLKYPAHCSKKKQNLLDSYLCNFEISFSRFPIMYEFLQVQ